MRWRPDNVSVRYQCLFPLYAHLPPRWAYRLAAAQAGFFRRRRPHEESLILEQMKLILPQATAAQLNGWLDDYYCMVEQEALDTWYLQHQPIHELVTLQGFEGVQAARQQGRRVLLTSGHFGRYWLAGAAMRALGHTVGTVTRDGAGQNVYGLHPAEYRYRSCKLQRLAKALGGPFLVEGESVRPLYHALDNHLIALIFDVPYIKAHKSRVTVNFIGSSIALPAGIYRIAKRMQAWVAPFYMGDTGDGQVRAEFKDLLDPEGYNEIEFMGMLARQLEQYVLEKPGHWWLWPAMPMLRSNQNAGAGH